MIVVDNAFAQAERTVGMVARKDGVTTRLIAFDCTAVLERYPDAVVSCSMWRSKDEKEYTLDVTADGDLRIVTFNDKDMFVPQQILATLVAVNNEVTVGRAVFALYVVKSTSDNDDSDTPIQDTLKRVNEALEAAQAIQTEMTGRIAEVDAVIDDAKTATTAAQDAAASVSFITFDVNTDDGYLYLNNPERLSGINFAVENGYLNVLSSDSVTA